MVQRPLVLLTLVVLVVASGCGSGESIPKHGADEQKAIDAYNSMTPQQKIDSINKGPMPQAAKDKMIKDIKKENNMQ